LRQFVCTDADVCDGLAFVAELPDLEEVTLRNTQASQALVESLAQSPSLRRLDLAGCPLGAAAVDSLAMFRHLEELSLSDIPLASDRIGQLFGIPRLKALSLDSCGLKDAALADLPQPSTLTSLSLLGNRLSDQCCFRLRQSYPECEILLDNPAQLRNPALVCITPAASLNDIDPFDSQGFLHLSFETEVDEACLRFGRVWGLRSLALEDVSDIGLAALRGAPTLTELVLRPNGEVARPRLTSRGLEVLQTLPRLRKLSVTLPTPVTESLRKVGAARSLEELDLGACTDLGPDSRCLTELPTLRRLSLRGATWRTQCAELAACQTLEHLHMHSTEFRFEQLRGLDPPPALRELSLNCLSFTDEDWAVLCTWREVTSITLNDITGSRVPWAKLLALPRLERVVVDKCEIDVHSDGELPVSSALREINAAGLRLDEPEQERMLCRVAHLPCAVALSCEIKVIKIVHQLGSQREVELIERVGGVDPSRPALDYGSAVPPLSPAEETRRSIIHTWGGKVYVEAK
jgi:hypothetical protein